jgi:hypothetical protein
VQPQSVKPPLLLLLLPLPLLQRLKRRLLRGAGGRNEGATGRNKLVEADVR